MKHMNYIFFDIGLGGSKVREQSINENGEIFY